MALPVPSRASVAWRIKPLVWLLALAPAAWLLWGLWRALQGDVSVLGADPAETLVHGSGEMALRTLLATLLLGSLRDLFGLRWLVQLRRLLGLFAFSWASAHLLAYGGLELEGDLARLGADFLERPYILAGGIGLGAMIPLALTSTNGWRRRLGRRWSQLHRLVWLAALAACVHLIWQVRADLGEALVYVGLFAFVAGQRLWSTLHPRERSAGARRGPSTA
ncbi:MAG: ferric reductase-like transmembrane domain-containing protein [Pseudomonadales bacterium]|jgi:sulfoxide reductase heme-binding subunit YedZ|nr:ferric reductase-like transmembrane domain-containing protein [Pseudomonadales bacterium]